MGHDGEAPSTILVVDDEENVRDAVARILARVGYSVVSASGGEEALGLLRGTRKRIDLLLTDVVMTGLNGVELAALAQRENPGVGILFMSGFTESEVLRHGVQTQSMHLLRKPFTMNELVQAVQESLRETTKR
jgi:two-component system, cell cycle sensor histidine kinase and response regulator CckA